MSNPCPDGNGTTIGTFQDFTLQCDSRLFGDTISSQDVDTFLQCVDLCASFHPKCEGVVFNRRTCDFKAGIRRDGDSRRFDAAVAVFPRTSSGCRQFNGAAQAGRNNYDVFCDQIIAGRDIVQNHAATMTDCLGQCSTTGGCVAVSYDGSMDQGFKNCYLKSVGDQGPVGQSGIDSAVVNNAAVAQNPESSPNSPAPTPTVAPVPVSISTVIPVSVAPAPATTLTPVVPVSASSTGPDVTFATLTASLSLVPASVTTQTLVSVITSVQLSLTQLVSTTQVMTFPVGGSPLTPLPLGPSPSSTVLAAEEPGPTSQAWIAAPVVGSVAAVTVVAVAFVLWGRRSSRRRPSSSSSGGVLDRLPFMRARSEPGTPKSTSSRGGGQFFGNSWRVQRKKPSDVESDRSLPGTRSGPPATQQSEMAAVENRNSAVVTRPYQGSAMDGIPAFLRE